MKQSFETSFLAYYYPPSQLRKVPSASVSVRGIIFGDGDDCEIRQIVYKNIDVLPLLRCTDLFEKIEEHFINRFNEIKRYETDSHTYDD